MHEKTPQMSIGYCLNRIFIFGLFSFMLFCILGFFGLSGNWREGVHI
jgi:hypothetical protein